MNNKPLVYLASPYTHDSTVVRQRRFEAVARVAAQLTLQGYLVFAPIAMGHPIALHGCDGSWEAWAEMDRAILSSCCYKFMILMLEGWQQSKGIAAELEIARELNLPVTYLDPVKWISNEEKEGNLNGIRTESGSGESSESVNQERSSRSQE